MSEESFVRELERRADQVQGRPLRFEEVRRSAHRIRRRRRVATASAAAAAVAVAVLLPTALGGGSQRSDGPDPAPSPPRLTPGQTVTYSLDAPSGEPPAVPYQLADDLRLVTPDGAEHQLPTGTFQVLPHGDGRVALVVDETSGTGLRLHRLDADYEPVEDLGPVGQRIVGSPDGDRVAWTTVSAQGPPVLVVAEDGEVVEQIPLGEAAPAAPVGFTADGTVYEQEGPDGTPTFGVAAGDGTAPVPHLTSVTDASAAGDLVLGGTRYDDAKGLPWAGVLRDGDLLWEECCYLPGDISPDGTLVFGHPDEGLPGHRRLAVLDAETGELVVEFDGAGRATLQDAVWEDDTHLLAVVDQGRRQAVLRLGLDGTVEVAVAPASTAGMEGMGVLWILAGRARS